MELRSILEKRKRSMAETMDLAKQTPFKTYLISFLIFGFSYLLSYGLVSLIFRWVTKSNSYWWIALIIALFMGNIIGKKIAAIIEGVKSKQNEGEITA